MLTQDEALALTLGLLAARRMGLAAHAPGVEGALAKIERVLPDPVRERVRAVEETLVWDVAIRRGTVPDAEIVFALSTAARSRRQVTLRYRRPDGDETERVFDPYGLACQRGLWYATGHCHLRGDMRLFRLDRVLSAEPLETPFERPKDFDVLASVLHALGSIPRGLPMEVHLDTTIEHARRMISARIALLEEREGGGVVLRGYTDDPDWMAAFLSSLGCPLRIRQPIELRGALRRLGQQLIDWTEAACAVEDGLGGSLPERG
jgi:predicted DNA-binding transcriptional regulator YafY